MLRNLGMEMKYEIFVTIEIRKKQNAEDQSE